MGSRWAAASVVLLLACGGCSVADALDSGTPSRDARLEAALTSHRPLVETLEWSELDGLVTVVARNDTDRVLTGARADLTVLDSAGAPVARPGGEDLVLDADVPSGATYAFTVDLGPGADVDRVEVAFSETSWSSAPTSDDAAEDGGAVALAPQTLDANATGAVVGARATTTGATVASAVLQARLEAPDGRLVAVATTTGTCFDPRVQRRVWFQLDRPVPDGTTLGPVTAFTRDAPDLGGSGADPAC